MATPCDRAVVANGANRDLAARAGAGDGDKSADSVCDVVVTGWRMVDTVATTSSRAAFESTDSEFEVREIASEAEAVGTPPVR